jgi:hypothetical protein
MTVSAMAKWFGGIAFVNRRLRKVRQFPKHGTCLKRGKGNKTG